MRLSKILTSLILLPLVLTSLPVTLARQETQKETKPEVGKKERTESRDERSPWHEQAVQLLNTILQEADKVEDFRERVRLKARAAGLLWKQNEPGARSQFRVLLASIAQYQPQGKASEEVNWLRTQLRQEVIQEAMRCDSQFADELAKAGAEKPKDADQEDKQKAATDPQANLKEGNERAERWSSLALQTLSEDPQRAAKLAEKSLDEGVVARSLFNLFIPLKMSLGAERTNPLFERALTYLVRNPSLSTFQLQLLAVYIFPDLQLGRLPSESPVAPVVAQPVIHQFLNLGLRVLADTASWLEQQGTSGSSEQQQVSAHAYFLSQQLHAKFEQFGAAEAVASVNSLVDRLSKGLRVDVRRMVEANANPQASVGSLLDLAKAEKDPTHRDAYYAQAAMSAYSSGDYNGAMRITEKIENLEARRTVEQQIKRVLVSVFVERGQFDDAIKYAREFASAAERAVMLNLVARALAKKKDEHTRAESLLVEAEQAAVKADDSVEKAQALLWITETYRHVESARVFAALGQAVKSINNAIDEKGNPKVSTVLPAGQRQNSALHQVRATDLFRLDSLFQQLAQRDFMTTTSIAQDLSRLELRLGAQLAACQGILAPNQKKADSDSRSPREAQSKHRLKPVLPLDCMLVHNAGDGGDECVGALLVFKAAREHDEHIRLASGRINDRRIVTDPGDRSRFVRDANFRRHSGGD